MIDFLAVNPAEWYVTLVIMVVQAVWAFRIVWSSRAYSKIRIFVFWYVVGFGLWSSVMWATRPWA